MESLPSTRRDVYAIVTDRIVELLQRGVVPWRQPWANVGKPKNLASGKEYRGINTFILSAANYSAPYWLTFKQAQERGGHVRKGEKGFPVVYWHWFDRDNESGGALDDVSSDRSDAITTRAGEFRRARCMVRYYTVFNVTQCENVAYPSDGFRAVFDPIPACESIVDTMPNRPRIEHGGNRAYYAPATDYVQMPERGQFASADTYYETLFHELTHATAHPTRCNRKSNLDEWKPFGSADYSREELVAEMGAAFLCNHTGIADRTVENSAAYVAGWLKKLHDDKRCVVIAAAQAQKAADYILGASATASVSESTADAPLAIAA